MRNWKPKLVLFFPLQTLAVGTMIKIGGANQRASCMLDECDPTSPFAVLAAIALVDRLRRPRPRDGYDPRWPIALGGLLVAAHDARQAHQHEREHDPRGGDHHVQVDRLV